MISISFVVPFYNGEKYIRKCLDSIYEQDIPEDEYEVIVVDDCSTDMLSIELLKAYQKEHSNFFIIRNDHNLRAGGSRNKGVREARGTYIWFVDQDDFIIPQCITNIISQCTDNELDILYFDYIDVSDDLSHIKKHNVINHLSNVQTGLDYINKECSGDFWHKSYDTNVWHAVYRRVFLLQNNIFSPEVSYCEDMIVSLHAIILAKRIMAIPDAFYCYRCNPHSVFHSEVGKKGRAIFDASIYSGMEMIKLSALIPNSYNHLLSIVKSGGVHRLNSFTKVLLKCKRQQRRLFFDLVSKHANMVSEAMIHFSPMNKWILAHRIMVINYPRVLFLYVKLCR